ncbi:MAG TPA: hypothetical protein VF939_02845 [Puia sp.]
MKIHIPVLFGIFLNILSFHLLQGQQSADTNFYNKSLSQLRSTYYTEGGNNLKIYNGREYIRNGLNAKGWPFFESNDPINGSVIYNGNFYTNIDMRYDLVENKLVVATYTKNGFIELVPEKISSFSLHNHHFVHLLPEKNKNTSIEEGFYDELSQGRAILYARRIKKFVVPTNTEEASKYVQYNTYFIKTDSSFYEIGSKADLLKTLNVKKDELKKYIKSHKLNFKKDLENSLSLTVNYYSLLIM